ncbi:MAG: acyl-CoA dehydrogenase [Smithellaceae bacterium]
MDFSKTDEQELLIENLRELLTREATEAYIRECDQNHVFPEKVTKALLDNGFYLLGIPEEYGGTPVDNVTYFMAIEEFSRFVPPCGWPRALSFSEMLAIGSEEQKKICIELTKQGEIAFSFAITEPQAGSDSNAMAATATRKNGKVFLNGQKTFITFGQKAPYMLVSTKDPQADPMKSITFWFFPANLPGITVNPLPKIGWHMIDSSEIFLDNVEIEEKDMVGVEGEGFGQLKKNFEMERLTNCAQVLGMASVAFEDAARYANQRVQFGQKIGNYQLIQEKLTCMAIKLENMRNSLYKVAWEKDNDQDIQVSSAMAKLYCVQSAFEIVDDAMQIMGGIGYTEDCRIARLWRDVRAYRFTDGTDQIMIHIAGRALVKKYSK